MWTSVGDRVIDVTSEWRSFANDSDAKDRSRVGDAENKLMGSSDLGTIMINPGGKSWSSIEDSSLMKNSKGARSQGMSNEDRNLKNGYNEISTQANRINLGANVQYNAKAWFKKVYEKKILKGRPIANIAASCLIIACRKEGVPRSFKEISAISKVPIKDIGKCYKKICSNFNEAVLSNTTSSTDEYMPRFIGQLSLPHKITSLVNKIVNKSKELDLCAGRSPLSVAAACLYMTTLTMKPAERPHLKDICKVTGIADSTLKTCYKLMSSRIPELLNALPQDWKIHNNVESITREFG